VTARRPLPLLLVLCTLLATAPAFAQTPPAPASPPAATPTPAPPAPAAPIAVPDIVRRAEEVTARLRALEDAAAGRAELETIERRLPAVAEDVRSHLASTVKALADTPPASMLDNLASPFLASRALLSTWADTLARQATQAERELAELGALRATWQATRAEARRTGAPSAVLARVDATLAAVAGAEAAVKERRARVLSLQDRVSKEMETVEEVVARIARARAVGERRLLSRDGLPIWQAGRAADSLRDVPARLREWTDATRAALRHFMDTHGAVIPVHVLLWIGLSVALFLLHRRVPADVADDPNLAEASRILRYPFAVALLIAIFISPWLYGDLPRPALNLLALLGVFPVLRIYAVLAPRPLRSSFFALAAFFVFERLDDAAEVVPLFDQLVFLAEMVVAIVFIGAILAMHRRSDPEPHAPLVRALGVAMLAAMVGALLLGAVGYVRFGRLLGSGALSIGYFAMVFQAGFRVAFGLLAYALRIRPFTYLRLVERNRTLIERRAERIFWWLAVVGWVVATLGNLGLLWKVREALYAVLGATITRGNLNLSLGDVLAFAVTVWLSFVVSRLVRFVLEEDVYPRLPLARGVPNMFSTLLNYSILLVGFILAVAAMGVDLNRVTILVGAFGVGIGFGLQAVVNNFVSGLILLVERSIQVGDVIQVGEFSGEVRSIGMRASMVRTAEGGDVIVPNGFLATERVTNWTLTDRVRRVDLHLRVAFGADAERVLALLREVCANHPGVLRDPEPLVFFNGLGDNGLLFEVYAWTPRIEDALILKNSLGLEVLDALRDAGIEIPVPQRDVRLRDGGAPPPGPPTAPRS
jgi:potassium-dependent mechanosensitive channel